MWAAQGGVDSYGEVGPGGAPGWRENFVDPFPHGQFQTAEHEPLTLLQKKPVLDDGLHKDAKHHLTEDDYEKQDAHEIQAGMAKHHCTDVMCVAIFLLALAGLGMLMIYGAEEGDIRRLSHGYNFTGHLCGVDAPGEPFLYWCQKPSIAASVAGGAVGQLGDGPIELDLRHPVCVATCPTSYNTTRVCFQKVETVVHRQKSREDGSFYVEESNKYVFNKVNDYVSKPFLNRYCLPEDVALMAQLMNALNGHKMTKILMEFSQIPSAAGPMWSAVVIACILGYVYIFILDKFASCLVYVSILLVVVLSTVIGLYLIVSEFTGGIDGIPNSGDAQVNWIVGLCLLAIAGIFVCFAICAREQIETAIGCIQAAADCMFDMPSLLFEPLLSLLAKLVLGVCLIYGFLQLASVGKVKTMTLQQFTSTYESIPGAKVSGVFRTFEYHESQYWYMGFYIFVSVWIICLVTALSQFVIAYSVQLWYFSPYIGDQKAAPACPLFRGYYIGASCHLGSLAFGSLAVTIFTILRAVLGTLAQAAEHEGNGLLAALAKCLFCCISCYERCIEFINKNAYIDIAINSTSFCTAARNALQVIASEIAAISFLNGATWVFSITGYALITSSGTFLVWLMVRNLWFYNDVASAQYIHDPIAICILAAIICFLVSVGFMVVFDMVSDSVLYCFATEERRRQRNLVPLNVQYAPPSLHRLIQKHSDSGDPLQDADGWNSPDPLASGQQMWG